jgi:hypothetical protein
LRCSHFSPRLMTIGGRHRLLTKPFSDNVHSS